VPDFFPDSPIALENGRASREQRGGSSLGARVARAWVEETSFDPRRLVAHLVSRAFPQFSFTRTRTLALRAAGVRIGERSGILGPIDITGAGDIRELFSVGEDTFISGPLHVDLGAPVRIGSHVQLGHHVVLLTINHEMGPANARCGPQVAAPIIIGDGVWIASRVTVLPGVSIGDGSVVAAGAVVSRDVPPNSLVAGVPARVVRALEEGVPPRSQRWSSSPPSCYPPRSQDSA
jgi:maltose O-acetyltransferase